MRSAKEFCTYVNSLQISVGPLLQVWCPTAQSSIIGGLLMDGIWPNFFIVGAMRSGSTSMHEYLQRVDGICMSSIKEPNFFIEEIGPYDYLLNAHFQDEEKYLLLFKPTHGEKVLGESSVSYLYDSKAASRIHAKIPHARIVIILRDPIQRAYSHFLHHLHHGFDNTFDFLETIKRDYAKEKKGIGFTHLYVDLGLYYHQVKRYLDLFGKERVKIIIHEDEFKPRTRDTVQDVVHFLGLKSIVTDGVVETVFGSPSEMAPGSFVAPRFKSVSKLNKVVSTLRRNNLFLMNITQPITSTVWKNFLIRNREKPALTDEAYIFLHDIYREDVRELCKILPKRPSWANKY